LDNYESTVSLAEAKFPKQMGAVIALGAERGWSGAERQLLRQNQFVLANLGQRVLRTETACIAAIALLKAKLGLS
jgi:16S rRNA (uracil1498-N3)-methyltransferase